MRGLVVAKVVGGVVLFLILAVVGAGLYLLENLDGLVKQAIEQVGSDLMGAQVLVEQRGTQTNVQSLLDGMPESEAFDGAAASDSADVELAIKRIKFADGGLELRSGTLGNHDLSLPGFNLKRIGSATDGKTPDEVSAEIAMQLTSLVASAVSETIADISKQRAKAKLRGKLGKTAIDGINKLKGLFRKPTDEATALM